MTSSGMTTRERVTRMFEHRQADRIPMTDSFWSATITRWQREGLPADATPAEYFELDRFATIIADITPRYAVEVVEETDEHTIETTAWGVTLKRFKHVSTTPEYIDFKVKNPDAWRAAKKRMTLERDRVDWKRLENHYAAWRRQGAWIQFSPWFGFDVTHSHVVGTERFLMALIEQPDWCMDMFDTFLTHSLHFADMIWDAGYTFDSIKWCDDMGYKNRQFFSIDTYREMLKPFHQRAIDWAQAKGIKTHLHSCGDVRPFVPELIAMGLDALNPLEVKAGMDPVALKAEYGDSLLLHGGINATLWDKKDQMLAEIERVVPAMMARGGYIFSSDHSVPSAVSMTDFKCIVERVKQLGRYE